MRKRIIKNENSNCYILNTNERFRPNATKEMIKYKKASCWGRDKKCLNKLQVGDIIYLYQNKKGIVAYGTVASDVYKKANEAYIKLENFINIVDVPIKFPFNRHTLYRPSQDNLKMLPNIKGGISVWLLPSKDDYDKYFIKKHSIIWTIRKRANIKKDDIVYIYVSNEKKIRYKCRVVSRTIENNNTFIIKMKFLSKYSINNVELTYESLKNNGLNSTIQSVEKIKGNLLDYINEIDQINNICIKMKTDMQVNKDKEIINYIIDNGITTENNKFIKEKQKLLYTDGKIIPKRIPERAAIALKKSKYLCEFNKKDKVFKRESGINYTESHHLIPISKYKDFKYTLDIEPNIVSLCCHCHRVLHYGSMKEKIPILKKLYNKRINDLKQCNLQITFKKLLNYYK